MSDPYGIIPHTEKTARLRPQDRSRYGQIRLSITRNKNGTGTVSVVVRSVADGQMKDTRLAAASINLTDGTLESRDPLYALRVALRAVTGENEPG